MPFQFTCSEAKLVLEGKLAVRDEEGVVHTAGPGEMFVFRAPVTVTFLAESRCLIFYAVHRTLETI